MTHFHKTFITCTLLLASSLVGACSTDVSESDENESATVVDGDTSQAQEAIVSCNKDKVEEIKAAYIRGFGRLPDTEEGVGRNELAYWCAQPSFPINQIIDYHAAYMRSYSTPNTSVRRATILRSYEQALDRTGVVGLGLYDVRSCELDYWDTFCATNYCTFWDLSNSMKDWALDHGYSCTSGHTYDSYAASYKKSFSECGPMPFIGGC